MQHAACSMGIGCILFDWLGGQGAYPTEMWCDELPGQTPYREGANRMQYPLDVAEVVPEGYRPPKQPSAASSVGISSFLVVISTFVTALLCI